VVIEDLDIIWAKQTK